MKKFKISILVTSLLLSLSIMPVQAVEFNEGNESKYIQLCSSSNISRSNQSVCREFNKYLKEKNNSLQESIAETNSQLQETQRNIDEVMSSIATTNDEIVTKEQEIAYLEETITALEADITSKEDAIRERMYMQQSYLNSDSFVEYIFGASSFGDFFSRITSVNEITSYDDDLITQLATQKEQVNLQKETVKTAKENLEAQKQQLVSMQQQYEVLFAQQNEALLKAQQEQMQTQTQQGELDAALSLLVSQTQVTYVAQNTSNLKITGDSKLGQAIANKALTKVGYMYLWGGCHSMSEVTNPDTTRFDCSGLVSWAYYQAGVNIGTHTTSTLLNQGIAITSGQLQAGDIILFNNSSGHVCHVGIAINNSQMVHAPQTGSPVQVSDLSSHWRARVNCYRRLY